MPSTTTTSRSQQDDSNGRSQGRRKSLHTRKTLSTDSPAEAAAKQHQRDINRVQKQESRRRKKARQSISSTDTRAGTTLNTPPTTCESSPKSSSESGSEQDQHHVLPKSSHTSPHTNTSSSGSSSQHETQATTQWSKRSHPMLDLRHGSPDSPGPRRSSFMFPRFQETPMCLGGVLLPPPFGALTPPQSPTSLPPLALVVAGLL